MAFGKHIIVISGSGQTGLVKLSGSFDGLNKVKGECRADAAAGGGKLYVISGDVTEINVEGVKTTFEAPIFAKGDIYCLLVTGGKTLAGSSGGRADRRQLEARVEAFKRERLRAANAARQAEVLTREAAAARDEAHRHDALSPSPSDGVAAEDERPSHEHVAPPHVFRDAGAKAYARPSEAPFAPTGRRTAEASGTAAFDGTNFYQAIKPQIDELFVRYPAEARLNALVPNSKWVRVDVDADDSYVIGVLFDLSLPIFVCYGVPGVRTVPPPREIAPSCVWLPLDNDRPDAEGYWMIYQSATDGKCVT